MPSFINMFKDTGPTNKLNLDQMITLAAENVSEPKAGAAKSNSQDAYRIGSRSAAGARSSGQTAGAVKNERPYKPALTSQPSEPMQTVQPTRQAQNMKQGQTPQANETVIDAVLSTLNSDSLVQGFILSEILGKPKAKIRRGSYGWNSRF